MKLILRFVYSFLYDGIPYVLMFIPVLLFVRLCYLSLKPEKHSLSRQPDIIKEALLLGFSVYLILLFTQTFIVNSAENEIRLIPFQIITEQIIDAGKGTKSFTAFVFNILGNIGVFVPIGVFAAVIFKKHFWGTVLIGFYISLVIETVQLPLDRTTDIDDLILNTLGAAAGYGIYKIILKIKQHRLR